MDDYATKIKISAENLIRVIFPEKALELDQLVSVCFIIYLISDQFFKKATHFIFSLEPNAFV